MCTGPVSPGVIVIQTATVSPSVPGTLDELFTLYRRQLWEGGITHFVIVVTTRLKGLPKVIKLPSKLRFRSGFSIISPSALS